MPVDTTLERLDALTEEEADELAERYWDDMNSMHPRNRDANTLEPLLDRYAQRHDDLTRFDFGMAAGELGSRLHYHDQNYDGARHAVEQAYTEAQDMQEIAPASAECMERMIGDVLPKYMDKIGL